MRIKINGDEIQLTAQTSYGVLRGLESLIQLLKIENGKAYWPALELKDSPRYAWRGLMIDVGRHFIPKEIILRNLEAMAAVKLNVLHWHLSDYQGFRVESKVFPKLHELGSNGAYYTQDDIKEIVAFAKDRGIRIVPEFDMPGHSSGFLVGYPELGSAPGPYKLATNFGILPPVIDPTREEVYQFIDVFVKEMSQLFPDEYFHIGGDEVNYAHWDSNESIQAFMKEKGIADNHALQAYFNERLEKILASHHKKMIGWDEILNPNLSNNIVVQSWRSHKSLFQAVQKGSKAILSSGYYLDHKHSSAKHYSVDPEVMAGAVNVKPDSLHWQQYDLTLNITENKIKTSMILYGEQDSLRGLFYMMDNAMGFEKATLNGNELTFTFASDYGEIDFEATFIGDSISGNMSLGLLSFPFNGSKKGGTDVVGTSPPKVEQVKPLTDADKRNILGGEAAMWTEIASAENIDSRIWPRTAAMAEKWWTPAELTKDSKDMYRRLEHLSSYLDLLGVQHIGGQNRMIADLAGGKRSTTHYHAHRNTAGSYSARPCTF
jgi:hexosaminidase